jgi:hypothetical protein
LDAIKRFEGPAKGIKLKPNEERKTIMSSMKDAIRFPACFKSKDQS